MKEMLDSKNYDKLEGKTKETVGYDVTFTITNSGDVKGSDVAQIYLGAPVSRDGIDEGVQFVKYQLAGFQRVEDLEPGESREVTIHVSERTIYVAEAEDELVLSETVNISTESEPEPTPTPEATQTPTPAEAHKQQVEKVVKTVQYVVKQVCCLIKTVCDYMKGLWG
ncbi:Fibronectin type III-like domain-containing protein [Pseudobutyrivibrio sp. 49]|nr:Fibronectin type III-like domain-containing protein [Pseudobutyrivibrio sp. 49]